MSDYIIDRQSKAPNGFDDSEALKVDEDARLDYQQQRDEDESISRDSFFAPSQGF